MDTSNRGNGGIGVDRSKTVRGNFADGVVMLSWGGIVVPLVVLYMTPIYLALAMLVLTLAGALMWRRIWRWLSFDDDRHAR